MYKNNKLSWLLYGVGLLIVVGTHIYMLMLGGLPYEQMNAHALINVLAGFLLAAGWLSRKA
jgi:hypothetical protein